MVNNYKDYYVVDGDGFIYAIPKAHMQIERRREYDIFAESNSYCTGDRNDAIKMTISDAEAIMTCGHNHADPAYHVIANRIAHMIGGVPVNQLSLPKPKKIIFNNPATIVLWADGTKTVVKCQDDDAYSRQVGLLMCIAKKAFGNDGKWFDILKDNDAADLDFDEDRPVGSKTLGAIRDWLMNGFRDGD